ncbi:MAG: hypothetical protein R3E91_05055 [Chlamydiales bacterium]
MENGQENKIWVFVKMVLDTQKVTEKSIMETVLLRAMEKGFNDLFLILLDHAGGYEIITRY